MNNLGETTLSECQDKEERATQEFWQERVDRVGNHKSPYLDTSEEDIALFTKKHHDLIIKHTVDRDVLEIGCGYGRNLHSFRFCNRYTGMDFVPQLTSEAASRIGRENLDPEFGVICMNFRNITPDNFKYKYDVVVGVSVITSVEHEFPKVLETLKSVLKPGGYILWLEEEWYRIDWKD